MRAQTTPAGQADGERPRRPAAAAAPPAVPRRAAAAGALLLLAVLAGCSSGSSNSSGGSVAGPAAAGDKAAGPAATVSGQGGSAGQASQPEARIAASRALVRKMQITYAVQDVPGKADEVGRIADRNGGTVFSDNRSGAGLDATAEIVLKVDPDKLSTVLGQLARLGHERARSSSTDDVTEDVADVSSRVATMQASIARVRAILSRASSVGDVVSVEGELAKREAELESLQARQRALAGQVALATVTVNLVAEAAPAPLVQPAAKSGRGFPTGLRNGWHAFTAVLGALLTALGAVLPFALLAVPVLLVAWRVGTQRRRPTPAVAGPTGAAAPPPPA